MSLVVAWAGARHCKNVHVALFFWHKTFSLPAQTDSDKLWACSAPARFAIVPKKSGDQFHLGEAWWGQAGIFPALPDLQGFTSVLCSRFEKQGKEHKKSSAPSTHPCASNAAACIGPARGATHITASERDMCWDGVFSWLL